VFSFVALLSPVESSIPSEALGAHSFLVRPRAMDGKGFLDKSTKTPIPHRFNELDCEYLVESRLFEEQVFPQEVPANVGLHTAKSTE
jgi:hypothetical protein